MTPYWEDEGVTLHVGDCREVLTGMAGASVDAVVTDPPAGVAFMGRDWDSDKGGRDAWIAWLADRMKQACRVLKPGGHALVWALPRTSHWTAMALEGAGFEIRDCIVHVFGSGFPKSLDVSKAIDRARDDRAEILNVTAFIASARDATGWTNRRIDEAFGFHGMAGHWTARPHLKIAMVPTWDQWLKLKHLLGFGDEMDAEVWRLNGRKGQPGEAWHQREVIGERTTGVGTGRGSVPYIGDSEDRTLTAPATEMAKRWEGWGTALKPSQEHWWLVRKPLGGTVASNVLTYGTGALNIDGCRIDVTDRATYEHNSNKGRFGERSNEVYGKDAQRNDTASAIGRWPTNVVFTHGQGCVQGRPCEAECPVVELDRQSGATVSRVGKPSGATASDGWEMSKTGGASRFFPTFRYEAKASTSERPRLDDGTTHPTVKPVDLMRWLVRLVTPPGGTVLDPFAGSGTTAEACVIEGFRCVLIELEQPHAELIKRRLTKPIALNLFGGAS
ncbi:DNA methyltransferase [Sphaerisporangium sp. TRM90804]|uniref:DNA methyltransferase n=1 Tax=Sphaerisporangium sp. TRM90804 TaxID=3031113 RepID=UPI00244CA936|nr:DNA methyltransferase [Sphaerisporangium sp. TRM90804]MDH2424815.1 DNA methyltransferase [Sphaerisporangium sp. TRM90804]